MTKKSSKIVKTEAARRHKRVELPLLVQYRFGAWDQPRLDYALNMSQSGLLIESDIVQKSGTIVFVQITTRDHSHYLEGEGKVIRTQNGGCAIELTGFDEKAQAILDQMVQKALDEQEDWTLEDLIAQAGDKN